MEVCGLEFSYIKGNHKILGNNVFWSTLVYIKMILVRPLDNRLARRCVVCTPLGQVTGDSMALPQKNVNKMRD